MMEKRGNTNFNIHSEHTKRKQEGSRNRYQHERPRIVTHNQSILVEEDRETILEDTEWIGEQHEDCNTASCHSFNRFDPDLSVRFVVVRRDEGVERRRGNELFVNRH